MTRTTRTSCAVAAMATVLAVAGAGCAKPADSTATKTSGSAAATSAAAGGSDLKTLVPTPADTTMNKGPDTIADNGIHLHYQVNGTPAKVMDAYKAALKDKGWDVTTIVTSGGDSGGAGATYTATHGDNYGVVDGGGYQSNTFIDVCVWPAKPAEPNCSRSSR